MSLWSLLSGSLFLSLSALVSLSFIKTKGWGHDCLPCISCGGHHSPKHRFHTPHHQTHQKIKLCFILTEVKTKIGDRYESVVALFWSLWFYSWEIRKGVCVCCLETWTSSFKLLITLRWHRSLNSSHVSCQYSVRKHQNTWCTTPTTQWI
jgi:hypothetical protein